MLLGFGYLYKCAMFYLFFKKSRKLIDKKKIASWPTFCSIIFFVFA